MQLPKRNTNSGWASDLTVYASGRILIETDTFVHRIADGVRFYSMLPIAYVGPDIFAVLGDPGSNNLALQSDNTTSSGLKWAAVSGSGTITTVSVASANGFTGTVANPTSTPALTVATSITGVLKGDGTAISAAAAGTDYSVPAGTETLTNKTISGSSNTLSNIGVASISATGTPSSTTYLRGDGSWSTPAGGGGSGIVRSIATITTTTTLGAAASTDYVALIGTSGVVTLPTAVGNTNRYTLKNVDTTNKTVSTTSSQTIDGSTTVTLTPNTAIDVLSDNSNWWIV